VATFNYQAKTTAGKEVKGSLQAVSEERARALLRANNLIPVTVSSAENKGILGMNIGGGKVTTKEKIIFSRQLASMIHAGVPVFESITALVRQAESPTLRKILQEIAYDIEGGRSLSQALGRHQDTFSQFYLGVIRTGEASGHLSDSLIILADYLEQNYAFMRKVRSALMYPAFVIVVVIVVIGLMLAYVVPPLVELFQEAQVPLPLPTRMLIGVTNFFNSFWYLIITLALVVGIILRYYFRTPEGRYTLSSLVLHVPILNTLFVKIYLTQLTSIMDTLFRSDVPVLESLRITQSSMSNKVYQQIIEGTAAAVKDGASLSEVWENEPYIPPMLTTMIAVGERSGEVHKAFSEAQRFFKRDVDEILEQLTVFLEPLLVIILAIGVGIIAAAIILPIYNLVLVI
jgi:type IV pilus assembly protein PilC